MAVGFDIDDTVLFSSLLARKKTYSQRRLSEKSGALGKNVNNGWDEFSIQRSGPTAH